jgi:tagatose 6-phosphate kinase
MILTVTLNPAIDKVYFVDKLILGEVNRPISCTLSAGGKGLNVARVAYTLGGDVTALGFIGGRNGEYIKSEIEKFGIACNFTKVSGETRINTNISDSFGNSTELLEQGPTVSKEEADMFIDDYTRSVVDADVIAISGSMPKGIEPDFYVMLRKIAKDKRVIIDTSGIQLKKALESAPFMVKPNKTEIAELFGFEPTSNERLKDALKVLYDKGVEVPLITLGKDGAAVYVNNEFLRLTPPSVTVKNAVGSGDSTVGGITYGIDKGLSIIDSVRLGMAAGCANTQFDETGFVSRELTEKYFNEVKVEEL